MAAELSPEEVIALNRLTLVARLLAGTAHDLNNALMIIGGSAELLAGLGEPGDAGRRAVDRIQANATRASDAIQELMHFARDRGDTSGAVSLRDVVSRAVRMRGFAARRAGIVLAFDAASLPQAVVEGISGQLLQAVLDLLINAEQAIHGGADATVTIEVAEAPDHALVRIIDNGRGIRDVERAFDPFVTTRPVPDATGLGLAAARYIARAHGGDVTLEARSPGSCATLRLPRHRK